MSFKIGTKYTIFTKSSHNNHLSKQSNEIYSRNHCDTYRYLTIKTPLVIVEVAARTWNSTKLKQCKGIVVARVVATSAPALSDGRVAQTSWMDLGRRAIPYWRSVSRVGDGAGPCIPTTAACQRPVLG